MPMLRQLVAQLEDIFYLWGSVNNPFHYQLRCNRWCDFNEDEYCGILMAADWDTSQISESSPAKKCRVEFKDESEHSIVMHEELWRQMPEDLLEAVISRLPIASLFRFRAVCKKWNSFPDSLTLSNRSRSEPWFYIITNRSIYGGTAYDPSSMKFHHLGASDFPENIRLQPVASAGGLICLFDVGDHVFYVCNPLKKAVKKLPEISAKNWSKLCVGMSMNDDGNYKIVWTTSYGDYDVYDSKKGSWVNPGCLPSFIKLPLLLNLRSQSITVDHTVYLMTYEPEGMVSYDLSSGEWRQYLIPSPVYLSCHTLAECDGRIMLAGLVSKNAATCFCIWELQKMSLLWKEVDRMPNVWCLDFYGKYVTMVALGNKGLILMCLRSEHTNLLVTYDMNTREWVRIPAHKLGGCKGIAKGTAFYPCISSMP